VVSAQARFQSTFAERFQNEEVSPTFEELMGDPPSATWTPAAQEAFVKKHLKSFCDFVDAFEQDSNEKINFQAGAPKPASDLRTIVDPSSIKIG
jgi:hypothetical protein